jgi:hypothetical protein
MTAMWAVWPTEHEIRGEGREFRTLHRVTICVLSLMFAWQAYWSVVALRNDWYKPYTGARDAAAYLKISHLDTAGCAGYTVGLVGVQPYFDHNIFANLGGPEAPAYYHQTTAFENTVAGIPAFMHRTSDPACLVVSYTLDWNQRVSRDIKETEREGYDLVHVSKGTAFFKDEPGELQLYLIFVRTARAAQ